MVQKVVVSPQEKRVTILHDVAKRLATLNVDVQLEVAVETLEFLKEIEGKTADDLRKIRDQEKLVDILSGDEYHGRLSNLFTEKMDALSDEHLERYHSQMLYEDAISEVNFQIVPALDAVQEELVYGLVVKPTLQ